MTEIHAKFNEHPNPDQLQRMWGNNSKSSNVFIQFVFKERVNLKKKKL